MNFYFSHGKWPFLWGYIDVGDGCKRSGLCWWQLWDVGDKLKDVIYTGKEVTNIIIHSLTSCHKIATFRKSPTWRCYY